MTSSNVSLKSGILSHSFDTTISPAQDFFRYVNGKWLSETDIPVDRAAYGHFHVLLEETQKRVRAIIEEQGAVNAPAGSNAQKIGDLYRSFMNEERIEKLGITPIAPDLERTLQVRDFTAFVELMAELEAKGSGGFFYAYINADARQSDRYIAYIGQSGLSLPDEAYYREEEHAELREELVKHITAMFTLAHISDPAGHAARVLKLETEIASHHWDTVRDRDVDLTYNKHTFQELLALTPHFPWKKWMAATDMPEHILAEVVVSQPSFFTGVDGMFANFDAESWSSWLTWHLLSGAAAYLSSEFVNQNFAFYGTILSGVPTIRERWKRAVGLVEGGLGEAVGEIFVQRHFPEEAKVRMHQLVANLIEAYRQSINEIDWMGPETKEKAQVKLAKFTPKIGYPDKWKDYSKLSITPHDLIGNVAAIAKFGQDHEFEKIGKPMDRDEWHMTPQTINAYYNPVANEIVFPAAILQPPFFDLSADDAVNYGAIGAIIGHEIGHGFDDQGSKFDGDGNLNDWWSEADRAEFENRTSKLIDQYEALHPTAAPDVHVNGALTIGENIGDLAGLTVAYKAYLISLGDKDAPEMDGFSGLQRLFIGYAQAWCGKQRPEEVRRRVATDPHSPDEFRCNQIVRNFDGFYEAFKVTEGDKMYLSPSDRVTIW